ncbi:AraC family transcriptional regulator [Ewingella americana]|uniref:AraC family transcriptional regulator n=1 Tax=Ewingella americana TaxID=41202 RepID=UPI0012AD342B|nr:AraC family transcriptional regulator [Ewingella americana]MRT05060.1 helix-turn-helix domain-containing protein [Ewingella americana]
MDPLSDVLSQLNADKAYVVGLRTGGDWGMHLPPPGNIKFNAVVEGSCWLTVDGEPAPIHLQPGDCFILTRPRAFTLTSAIGMKTEDAVALFRQSVKGMLQYGTETDFFMIGGRFNYGQEARLLLDSLPSVAVVNANTDSAPVLRWALELLVQEVSNPSPGGAMMVQQLGNIMLIQVLRQYLGIEQDSPAGWLYALSDPRVNAALEAMHADPQKRWSVQQLAEVAGVSRSTFALNFKQKVGFGPLEYLLRWRMQLASRRLAVGNVTVSAVAQSLGYDSDSAFSNAFKRVMLCSPREYRERQRGQ